MGVFEAIAAFCQLGAEIAKAEQIRLTKMSDAQVQKEVDNTQKLFQPLIDGIVKLLDHIPKELPHG